MHDAIKHALVEANERDTRLIFRTLRNTARVFRNVVSKEVVAIEKEGCKLEDIKHLVAGARGRGALERGDPNGGIISAGMVIGPIDDVPTCEELVQRMVRECREQLSRAQEYFK